ncbi:cell division protein FtsQ/DivIB [Isoptericola sp. b490]|uniref:cell division protein FtsQ/DivIB n=1 Tax=Actinotalea lenta TaxID=3064654 RepID=UPI0027136F4C|nr:cell division protein FtsQ/DivIB [Isoptericola sp. b490]MDO8120909.1 cell division protein FtsQ/DivIB [Isoptericola sp. b490]
MVVSAGSAARFAERVRMRRRIRRDRVLAWSAGGAVAATLAWLLLVSPVLALDPAHVTVRVRGDRAVVDVAAVTAVLTHQAGTPLPRLDTVGLRRQVLDVPGVRAASVARAWPHGLVATVVARDPVAAVPAAKGYTLLDADGVQVGRSADPPSGLPVVSVPLGDPAAMQAVLLVLQSLPSDLAGQVTGASAKNQDAVSLTLSDGSRVEWGSADRSALKAAVVETLRGSPASKGVKVYDVSAPTLPITRS